jgi:hypothetical protein
MENSMRVAYLDTSSDLQMSVQRTTPYVDGAPQKDEVSFDILGYCPSSDAFISEHVLLPMSEAKRLIGILEVMTMHENEHMGTKLPEGF